MKPPRFLFTIATAVYRSRLLARLLFGVRVPPVGPDDYYFDISTWVIVRRASRELNRDMHLIDLGTGTQAIIGISLWRKFGCKVTSVDINPEILKLARANIELNNAPIETVQSQFFDNVLEPFDLVTFNPPYIRTADGDAAHLSDLRRSQWDGGEDGLEITRGFLKGLAARPHPARFCLALNSMHADMDVARALIRDTEGLTLEHEYKHPFLPIIVFTGSHEVRGDS